MKIIAVIGIIMAMAIVVSWGKITSPPPLSNDSPIIDGIMHFGSTWFETVLKEGSKNHKQFTSGIGVGLALALSAFAADGNTKSEILNLLNATGINEEEMKNSIKSFLEQINESKKFDMQISNKIFMHEKFEMKKEFKNLTKYVFDAEAQSLDFHDDNKINDSIKIINDWIKLKTKNKTKYLLHANVMQYNSIILVNTIYFNKKWASSYQAPSTMLWHDNKGKIETMSSVYVRGNFKYGDLKDVDAKYYIIPYESDPESKEHYSMVVIVPNKITGLSAMKANMKKINSIDFVNADGKIKEQLTIQMPKFQIESMFDMDLILPKYGIESIFDDWNANFSSITNSSFRGWVYMSTMIQKTFVDVSEKISVNDFGNWVLDSSLNETMLVNIDRPFVFSIIREKNNHSQLFFNGYVTLPVYTKARQMADYKEYRLWCKSRFCVKLI